MGAVNFLEDPVQWELNQLAKLEELRKAYDWGAQNYSYKQCVRLLQRQAVIRQQAATARGTTSARAGSCVPGAPASASVQVDLKREKPSGWVASGPAKGKKYSSFTSLSKGAPRRSSPRSLAQRQGRAVRYPLAPLHLGRQGNWRIFSRSHRKDIYHLQMEQLEVEEDEDPDDAEGEEGEEGVEGEEDEEGEEGEEGEEDGEEGEDGENGEEGGEEEGNEGDEDADANDDAEAEEEKESKKKSKRKKKTKASNEDKVEEENQETLTRGRMNKVRLTFPEEFTELGHSSSFVTKARMKATPHKRKKQGQEGHTAIEIRHFGDCVGTDNAGPYKPSYNSAFNTRADGREGIRSWNEERGITTSWNVAGESDMNNRTEGFIGRLIDTARALLIHAGLPEDHCPVAYPHACHILNRMPVPGGGVMIWVPDDTTERYHVVYSVKYDESKVYRDAWRNGREISSTTYRGDEDDKATVDITLVAPERRATHEPAISMSNPTGPVAPASTMADRTDLHGGEAEVSDERAA
ncbi:MAG: hypothetical protein SGPRY_009601 [Prymnesium sp.]